MCAIFMMRVMVRLPNYISQDGTTDDVAAFNKSWRLNDVGELENQLQAFEKDPWWRFVYVLDANDLVAERPAHPTGFYILPIPGSLWGAPRISSCAS